MDGHSSPEKSRRLLQWQYREQELHRFGDILEVIFDPGTWRYRSTITEIGKTRKRRDWGAGGDEDGVVRHGIKILI